MNESEVAPSPIAFEEQFQALIAAAPDWLSELHTALAAAFDAGGRSWLLALVVAAIAGFAGERIACWRLNGLSRLIESQTSDLWTVTLGYALFRVLFDLAGVVLFGIFAWIALQFLVDGGVPAYVTLKGLLVAVLTFRAWSVVLRAILAPNSEHIRPIAMSTEDSSTFYRWSLLFIGVYVAITWCIQTLAHGGLPPLLIKATLPLAGIILILIANVFVWRNRDRLARLFSDGVAPAGRTSALRQVLAQSWPFMVSAWLMLLWLNWGYSVFTNDVEREQSVLISWWITLLFPIGDRLVSALLSKITTSDIVGVAGFDDHRRTRFVSIVLGCVRAIFIIVALMAMAVTWRIAGADLLQGEFAKDILGVAVDIGITLLIAYVLYEIVMSMLERHMPVEEEVTEEFEGEVGGSGVTREETLAPLLRGSFIVLLAIVVVLTVLSSLGVQILPLIAGASIVGVAIGFGSQKLVQDIISGVFFLIDDAFRRGEYIDIGEVKGTVEKISIRSMQLRHQLGALHTVPFGEIRHLTNYSRDWVMMKLKLRLTYGTDIEKVRKIVKKLGLELLDHPEIGEKFLQPLKSQGVFSMEDDSAMIVRVKFMTRPGDQFVIRKTVYASIRERFAQNDIEFAHRVVSVRLDGPAADDLSEDEKRQVAGSVLSARAET